MIALVGASVLAAVFAGLYAARFIQGNARLAALAGPFSAGALLFLFFDLVKETASLGQGLVRDPLLQLGLLAAFAGGALLLPAFAKGEAGSLRLAWLWALGIAAHGAGEGWIIGTEAGSASVTAPLGVASFVLHKVIEGFTIPVVAGAVLRGRDAWGISAMLAGVAVVGGLAGFASGSGLAPLVLFAAGGGAAAFAILRLGSLRSFGLREAAVMVLGVVVVYLAGLLHEIA
ncbi:MAG TPA: hypothetical protein VGR28_04990 [Candidatus Thermoplasmatota archaeon]|nr:hypothetical protein [Candidatus Thermoplasmatota archaeon]